MASITRLGSTSIVNARVVSTGGRGGWAERGGQPGTRGLRAQRGGLEKGWRRDRVGQGGHLGVRDDGRRRCWHGRWLLSAPP